MELAHVLLTPVV